MRHTRIVVTHYGGPDALRLVDEECPEPHAGEVRVRVLAAGVSLPDIMAREGVHPETPPVPYTPGWDLVGKIDRLGNGVSGIEPGQIVAAMPISGACVEFVWRPKTPPPYDFHKMLGWASDPRLSILLFEAILIRRSAIETGWGLLAKSWGSFAAGIFLTSLGDMGLWASANSYLPWPYSSVTWYVWFLASAAFALGPAGTLRRARHGPISA